MNTITQLELFEDKEKFSPESFEQSCVNNHFEHCIAMSINMALKAINDSPLSEILTHRTKANAMHDIIVKKLKDNLCGDGLCTDNDFQNSISGNDRDYFTYAGYLFLIKKSDASRNETSVTANIIEQKLESHVIEICYTIDKFWNNVVCIEYRYTIGATVTYNHILNIPIVQPVLINNENRPDDERPNVTLKQSIKEQITNAQ